MVPPVSLIFRDEDQDIGNGIPPGLNLEPLLLQLDPTGSEDRLIPFSELLLSRWYHADPYLNRGFPMFVTLRGRLRSSSTLYVCPGYRQPGFTSTKDVLSSTALTVATSRSTVHRTMVVPELTPPALAPGGMRHRHSTRLQEVAGRPPITGAAPAD
jgi:hypothetical protein